ncbi:MAG: 30S ribosomal protein S18 [Elusimicrobia bacterium]|nr:30S ribosomal protein S18 [Elusimicrobiota bacterium]
MAEETQTVQAAPETQQPSSVEGAPRPREGGRPADGQRRGRYFGNREVRPRKVCRFCVERKDTVEYKDQSFLRNFSTERGKILPGRVTGACSRHQRKVREAMKRARIMALMPFIIK